MTGISQPAQPAVNSPGPSLADMDWLRGLAIDARSPELVSAIDSMKRKYAAPSQSSLPAGEDRVAAEASEVAGQQYRYRQGEGWSDWVDLPGGAEPLQQDNLQYRFVYGGPAATPDTFKAMLKQVERERAAGTFASASGSVSLLPPREFSETAPEYLRDLARELDHAREAYLEKRGTPDEPAAKEALSAILWDDKGTFAPALRLAALSSSFLRGARGLGRGPVPDRDMLVRAISLVLAGSDLDPSSDATLELYREEAEFISDGLSRGAFPLQIATRRWRHNKRGSSYAEIGRATSQSAIPIVEGETVVVYVADIDGSMHVRKDAEFEDGRFQEILHTQGSTEATR